MRSFRVFFANRELFYIDIEANNACEAKTKLLDRLEDPDDGMVYEEATETGSIDVDVVNVFDLDTTEEA